MDYSFCISQSVFLYANRDGAGILLFKGDVSGNSIIHRQNKKNQRLHNKHWYLIRFQRHQALVPIER